MNTINAIGYKAALALSLITAHITSFTVSAESAPSSITKVVASNAPLIIANKFIFNSSTLGQQRSFYIHLPSNYSAKNSYPVLYILDAKRKMQKTIAITDDLADFSQRIPKMIVVGIETNKNRTADLSTLTSSKAFLNFITEELKPYIDSQYATNGENLLMGSSMGGEFVVRALLNKPEAFAGYFAISPSIYYSNFQLVNQASEIATSNKAINKELYLSVANEGWNQGVEELTYQLNKQPISGLNWQFTKRESQSHGSISLTQAYFDLENYYKNWAKPHFNNIKDFEDKGGIEGLTQLYAKRKNPLIPISILDHMALLYVDEKQTSQAVELSKLSVSLHPTSGRALRNLAHVYEQLNLLEKALSAYQQALAVAIKNNHRKTSINSHRQALTNFKIKYSL